ncbi:ankyrin repeat protein [Magpiepox virus 2]|nr:ankyrin repeat protein [Magpiepox virus 2]
MRSKCTRRKCKAVIRLRCRYKLCSAIRRSISII